MKKEEKQRIQTLEAERSAVDAEKAYLEREQEMIEEEWSTLKREYAEIERDRHQYSLELFVSMKQDLNRLAEEVEQRELRYRERRNVYLERKHELESQERTVSRLTKAQKRTAWMKPLRYVIDKIDAESVTVGTVILVLVYAISRLFF